MTSKRLTTYALNRKFIKHWLIDNDATQVELADAIGVSPVVLNRYINGQRNVPVSVLFSLAEEMRADVRDLVYKVEE
ncbi:helix-turn-helix domain-containing protein [Collinsella bouchesdurhonensis]|uniref:helix-turn-helix domain-containing protein n=1 Tax=Collinsella bouchesdurhonensis TaxID=1907654 RepID=UPI003F8E4EBB